MLVVICQIFVCLKKSLFHLYWRYFCGNRILCWPVFLSTLKRLVTWMSSGFHRFRKMSALVLIFVPPHVIWILFVWVEVFLGDKGRGIGCLQDFLFIFSFHHYEYEDSRYAWAYIFISLGCIPKVELLDHGVTLCLTFWGSAKLFFKAAALLYNPISNIWGFQLLHIFC